MKRLSLYMALFAGSIPAYGYIRSDDKYGDGSSAYVKRSNATAIQFYLNSLVVAGYQTSISGTAVTVISSGSNPVHAVRAAQAPWNAIAASTARFTALGTTASGINPNDNQNTVVPWQAMPPT